MIFKKIVWDLVYVWNLLFGDENNNKVYTICEVEDFDVDDVVVGLIVDRRENTKEDYVDVVKTVYHWETLTNWLFVLHNSFLEKGPDKNEVVFKRICSDVVGHQILLVDLRDEKKEVDVLVYVRCGYEKDRESIKRLSTDLNKTLTVFQNYEPGKSSDMLERIIVLRHFRNIVVTGKER